MISLNNMSVPNTILQEIAQWIKPDQRVDFACTNKAFEGGEKKVSEAELSKIKGTLISKEFFDKIPQNKMCILGENRNIVKKSSTFRIFKDLSGFDYLKDDIKMTVSSDDQKIRLQHRDRRVKNEYFVKSQGSGFDRYIFSSSGNSVEHLDKVPIFQDAHLTIPRIEWGALLDKMEYECAEATLMAKGLISTSIFRYEIRPESTLEPAEFMQLVDKIVAKIQ